MSIKVQEKWKWEDVRKEILRLEKEIGHIVYAVADHENLLKKALEDTSIPHIHDVSHKIALLLEKRYKEDTTYKSFTKELSLMRIKHVQGRLAHLIPLSSRKKSIFQNLGKTAEWAYKSLLLLQSDRATQEEKSALSFLEDYKPFIKELYRINKIIIAIEKEVKTKGLSLSSIHTCQCLIQDQSKRVSDQSQPLLTGLNLYLINTFKQVKGKGTLLCTSDIIESAFGKYKYFSSDNKMACVTKMVLLLSAITFQPQEHKMKSIFEKVKMEDIDNWTQTNIGQTSLKRRGQLFTIKKGS